MAIWQRTFYLDIADNLLKTSDLFPALDKFLKRDWSLDSGQCWGNPESNDIFVTWDNETNLVDEDIQVRVDLRNIDIDFIQHVIKLTKDFGLKLKIARTQTIEPELSEIAGILSISNADKFVSNPKKFLDDLEKGIIKLE
ncbi:MAG: hypothetical protein ABJH04_21330 [Cyclobacteriaceae bacterium]